MPSYVLAFRGQPGRAASPGDQDAWSQWFASLGSAVTDIGHQVGQVRTLRARQPGDPATAVLTGYVVISADSADAAAAMADGCPGLKDGVSVEVGQAVG